MAKLQIFFGGSLQTEILLQDGEEYSAGRSPDCSIFIDNLAVSRNHCVFSCRKGQWTVEDKQSSNGTFVNGERVSVRALKHQDRIVLGKHTLLFDNYGGNSAQQSARDDEDLPQAPEAPPPSERKATMFMQRDVVAEYVSRSRKDKPMVLVLEGRQRQVVPLDKDVIVIGGGDHCDLKIGGLFVKGEQAVVTKSSHGYRVTDKGGLRAVRVNGEKVKGQIALQAGDVISIAGNKISLGSL
jgi:pSer/pThr/pTyr-binding forkhead associated (FHA) protein